MIDRAGASEASDLITGTAIPVDGGYSVQA